MIFTYFTNQTLGEASSLGRSEAFLPIRITVPAGDVYKNFASVFI
jgi:hypothetical protein